jgi:general secretion pathway protein K
MRPNPCRRQVGAALLSALLIVSLVASLSAAALWQQWRLTEVERHERGRQQSDWILNGAMDWARLILREDARSGGADHLGEPWAVALQEARLSSFLASDRNASGLSDLSDVFLAGRIEDMQGRLNLNNLVADGKLSEPDIEMAERLFALIDLPLPLVRQMAIGLRDAMAPSPPAGASGGPFLPQHLDQLVWLGLSAAQVDRLAPHVSLLPQRTTLNLNTASAELISASLKGLALGQARKMVEGRQRQHWPDLNQANAALGGRADFSAERHGLSSRFFRVTGHLRQEDLHISQQALVRRDGLEVRVVWRRSQTQPPGGAAPP